MSSKAAQRAYYERNREAVKARAKAHYEANREHTTPLLIFMLGR